MTRQATSFVRYAKRRTIMYRRPTRARRFVHCTVRSKSWNTICIDTSTLKTTSFSRGRSGWKVRFQMGSQIRPPAARADRIAIEKQSQWLVTAFVASGMVFMLLPGTFLGLWNLISISRRHTLESLSSPWLQAHGQAQLYGWVGSFILGIGFYSLTKMQSTFTFPACSGWISWTMWTLGITLRWIAGVIGWHWRILMPLSGFFELAAFVLFYRSV